MAGKIIKIIPVTPDLSVILYHAPDANDRTCISIKQNEKVNNMPGQIMLISEDIPALSKALSEAANLANPGY